MYSDGEGKPMPPSTLVRDPNFGFVLFRETYLVGHLPLSLRVEAELSGINITESRSVRDGDPIGIRTAASEEST